MAKERFSASIDDDLYEQFDQESNKSALVEDLLRQHYAASAKTEAERLREDIAEERETVADLREEIDSREAKIEYLEAELEDLEDQQGETVDAVIEFAKEWATKDAQQRDFSRKNADGTVGDLPTTDVVAMVDDVLPAKPIEQVRATDSWDDLADAGYSMDTFGIGKGEELEINWDARARDIVGLTTDQRTTIREWVDKEAR